MRWRTAFLVLAAAAALGGPAHAANLPFSQGGTIFNVSAQPMTAMRFQNVVRQQFDLSCGAAALATILQYFYGERFSEGKIIDAMLKIGDASEISKRGFSMLEIKRFAEKVGFVSEGFRITDASRLTELKTPVLTLINTRGYKHFVVLKTVRDGNVIIADPAFGNTIKSLEEFERLWNGVILVVLSPELNGIAQFVEDFSVKARPGQVSLWVQRGLEGVTGGAGEF